MHGLLPFRFLAIHAFNIGILKDCRIIYASEGSNFSAHVDITWLNNSDLSQTLNVSTCRSKDYIPGVANCTKTDSSGTFMGNPPFNNIGFIDGFFGERKYLCDEG